MIHVHSSDQLRHIVFSRLRTWFPTPDEPVLDLNDLDVSSIVSLESVFTMLNRPVDVSKWDTRQVKDFSQCFYRASAVPDISNWNVDHATNFREMFAYASVHEPLNLTQWDMQGPRDIRRMFFQTTGEVDTRRWAFGEAVIWDWESAPPNWQKTPEAPWFWMFALAKAKTGPKRTPWLTKAQCDMVQTTQTTMKGLGFTPAQMAKSLQASWAERGIDYGIDADFSFANDF